MTQAPEQTMLMRNKPISARAWQEQMDSPGATVIDAGVGQLALIPERGQLSLYWRSRTSTRCVSTTRRCSRR